MRIDDILARRDGPVFSFEFFPPKTEEGERNLYRALEDLRELQPDFVSVTWGAGGSTREKTIEIVTRMGADHGLEAMAHLTCAGATTEELHAALHRIRAAGIENVLALRGDPPAGEECFTATAGGLAHASELAQLAAGAYDFCLVGACYPETHSECADAATDLQNLRAKVDAGVRVLITQLFFENETYFRFLADVRGAGIDVPVIPGVMPVTNVEQIKRFTSLCGATIPPALADQLDRRAGDPEAVTQFGVAYATLQCADLLARGAPGIHFYTLNRSPATRAILAALHTLRPWDWPARDDASTLRTGALR